jgi:chloramphenicol O-acetyltransferase type B
MTYKLIYKTFSFYNSLKTFVLTWLLSKRLKTFGREIRINAWCHFGSKTVSVGDYGNFNGMTVAGCGELNIKNGFHSGTNILVITSNHDYESQEFVPYGYKDISKSVLIGNAVWVGSNVTILPGTKLVTV